MKKNLLVVIAVMLLASLAGSPAAVIQTINLSQGNSIIVNCPSSLSRSVTSSKQWQINCAGQTATPTATRTPTVSAPTATFTVQPPTATLAPATPTASGGLIQPYASAPLCVGDDLTQWHGLWNYQLGCHYNYEQGDNPHLGDAIFGSPAAAWGGQTISWPWVSSAIENQPTPLGKHNGYKWAINVPTHNPWVDCTDSNLSTAQDTSGTNSNCITASRVELHILGSLEDSLARYHSSYVEYKICSRASGFTDCGIFRMGSGLTDFAQLQAGHYGPRVVRPGGVVDFGGGVVLTYTADGADLPDISGSPYVFDDLAIDPNDPNCQTISQCVGFYQDHMPIYNSDGFSDFPGTMAQWSTNDLDCNPTPDGVCHQLWYRFLYQVSNTWTLVDPNNVNGPVFICRDGSCGYNGSGHGMEEVEAIVPQSWDPDHNGFADLSGFTDRYGNLVTNGSCTAASFSCIPFSMTHVPVGIAANKHDQLCECSHEIGYDLFFNGQQSGWIKFPN